MRKTIIWWCICVSLMVFVVILSSIVPDTLVRHHILSGILILLLIAFIKMVYEAIISLKKLDR